MKTVSILGAGNVAFHLARIFVQHTIQVKQIYNRTLDKAEAIGEANKIRYTDKISELEKADLFVIASSDSAITELSLHIPYDDVLVVHTSGSMPMNALKGDYRKGVLYPLQTFTLNRILNYENIPFFIETETKKDETELVNMMKRVSNHVEIVDSNQRAKMHLSAVWACNFVNYMYSKGEEYAKEAGMKFDLLKPLITETTDKALNLSPEEAQTGPAKRNDQVIIEKHLQLLKDTDDKNLYQNISNAISKKYHEL